MQNQTTMFWSKSLVCLTTLVFSFCIMLLIMEFKHEETEKIVQVVFTWFDTKEAPSVAPLQNSTTSQPIIKTTERPTAVKQEDINLQQPLPQILMMRPNFIKEEQKLVPRLNPFTGAFILKSRFTIPDQKVLKPNFNTFKDDLISRSNILNSELKSRRLIMNPFEKFSYKHSNTLKSNTLDKSPMNTFKQYFPAIPPSTGQIRCILCIKKSPLKTPGEISHCPHKNSFMFGKILKEIMRPILVDKKVHHKQNHINLKQENECFCSSCMESAENRKNKKYINKYDKYDEVLDGNKYGHYNKHSKYHTYNKKCNCKYCYDRSTSEPCHYHKQRGNKQYKNKDNSIWDHTDYSY